MKRIYLVRHGNQDTDLFNVDAHLSKKGIAQAELLRDSLKEMKYDKFYSSKLKRAMETADILNQNWNLDIERRSELNEMDWGTLTGKEMESTKLKEKDFFTIYNSRIADYPYPNGENGEMAFERAKPIFDEIEESRYKSILIVCHGCLIRAILSGLLGVPFEKKLIFSKYLENTSITELLYDEKTGLYFLERLNDYTHLYNYPELQRQKD